MSSSQRFPSINVAEVASQIGAASREDVLNAGAAGLAMANEVLTKHAPEVVEKVKEQIVNAGVVGFAVANEAYERHSPQAAEKVHLPEFPHFLARLTLTSDCWCHRKRRKSPTYRIYSSSGGEGEHRQARSWCCRSGLTRLSPEFPSSTDNPTHRLVAGSSKTLVSQRERRFARLALRLSLLLYLPQHHPLCLQDLAPEACKQVNGTFPRQRLEC